MRHGQFSIHKFKNILQTLRFKVQSRSTHYGGGRYGGSKTGAFFQERPELDNQFTCDPLMKRYLIKHLPKEAYEEIEDDLVNFGHSVANEVHQYHIDVCHTEPVLQQYDAWGQRVDEIVTHPSWNALKSVAAREGLISIPYAKKINEWSRLYQVIKLSLYSPSSGLYSCPLAMTDGAASILQHETADPFMSAYKRLTSNDPQLFWTSGQWMTEKRGGSDVGNATDTHAVLQSDGTYQLYGYKWFTSAIDANMCLTLARIEEEKSAVQGTKGLSMFYMETRKQDGRLNGLFVEKLKKKLGTRQMPTAELILDGSVAHQLSETGRGIASISPMLTITRIHNSIFALGYMRRLLNFSKDFARKRDAFGKKLIDHPLHIQTLSRLEVEQQGGFLLLLKMSLLLGRVETHIASDQDKLLLRILTPLMKLYTGKQAVSVCSEALESFGGMGYIEDTGLPVYLRDAQVLSIWEGTTNVLSLDVLRSIQKTKGEVLNAFFKDAFKMINFSNIADAQGKYTQTLLKDTLNELKTFALNAFQSNDLSRLEAASRDFSYSLARVYIGCLLFEEGMIGCNTDLSSSLAFKWCTTHDLAPVLKGEMFNQYDKSFSAIERNIVYGTEYGE